MTCLSHFLFDAYQARLALLVACLCALLLGSCVSPSSPPGKNSSTGTRRSSAPLTYIAIGASDTFGTGTQDPYAENWPTDMSNLLGSSTHLINLGIPSMTLHLALTTELPVALDTHPDLVTIWLAVNDLANNTSLNSYGQDLDAMLKRLQAAAPRARIEVGNVPDLTSVPFFHTYNQAGLRRLIIAYNQTIATVVARHHAILVDLSGQRFDPQEFPTYISNDGLHPSATGYLRLATLFYNALGKI